MKKLLSFIIAFTAIFSLAFASELNFKDKNSIPDWAQDAIASLVEDGILSGNPDGTFAPDRKINRAEFCKIMSLATGVERVTPETESFPDVKKTEWYFSYVETAKKEGWVSGYPDGTFKPGNTINRAEVAKIMANAFELDIPDAEEGEQWFMRYFKALSWADLLPHGTDLDNLEPAKEPTRAEVAEEIYRARDYLLSLENRKRSIKDNDQAMLDFEYIDEPWGEMDIDPNSGDIIVEKNANLPLWVETEKGKPVLALSLDIRTELTGKTTKIRAFKFRRIGAGKSTDFTDAWLEMDGLIVSEKIKITDDIVEIPFRTIKSFGSTRKTVELYVTPSASVKKDISSRFVLYLPRWIDTSSENRVGLFPFGGSDIFVK